MFCYYQLVLEYIHVSPTSDSGLHLGRSDDSAKISSCWSHLSPSVAVADVQWLCCVSANLELKPGALQPVRPGLADPAGGAFAAHAPCLVRARVGGPGCFLSPRFAPPGLANTNLTLPRLSELTMHMLMLRDCACFYLGSHNQAAPERPTC